MHGHGGHGHRARTESPARSGERAERSVCRSALPDSAAIAEPAPPDIPEWPLEQRLASEKETLGFYVSGHPLDRFAAEVSRFSKKSIAELISEGKSVECRIAGIVTDFRTRRTKKGDLMAVFTLEDLTGAVETVVFPSSYPKFEPYMTADCPDSRLGTI